MATGPRRVVPFPVRSYALDMLLRFEDHEMWVSDAVRFVSEEDAGRWGEMLLARRRTYARYRLVPSRLPPTLYWLLPW